MGKQTGPGYMHVGAGSFDRTVMAQERNKLASRFNGSGSLGPTSFLGRGRSESIAWTNVGAFTVSADGQITADRRVLDFVDFVVIPHQQQQEKEQPETPAFTGRSGRFSPRLGPVGATLTTLAAAAILLLATPVFSAEQPTTASGDTVKTAQPWKQPIREKYKGSKVIQWLLGPEQNEPVCPQNGSTSTCAPAPQPAPKKQPEAAPVQPPKPVDTDNDGIPDVKDKCPKVPGPASNNGCPVKPHKPNNKPEAAPVAPVPAPLPTVETTNNDAVQKKADAQSVDDLLKRLTECVGPEAQQKFAEDLKFLQGAQAKLKAGGSLTLEERSRVQQISKSVEEQCVRTIIANSNIAVQETQEIDAVKKKASQLPPCVVAAKDLQTLETLRKKTSSGTPLNGEEQAEFARIQKIVGDAEARATETNKLINEALGRYDVLPYTARNTHAGTAAKLLEYQKKSKDCVLTAQELEEVRKLAGLIPSIVYPKIVTSGGEVSYGQQQVYTPGDPTMFGLTPKKFNVSRVEAEITFPLYKWKSMGAQVNGIAVISQTENRIQFYVGDNLEELAKTTVTRYGGGVQIVKVTPNTLSTFAAIVEGKTTSVSQQSGSSDGTVQAKPKNDTNVVIRGMISYKQFAELTGQVSLYDVETGTFVQGKVNIPSWYPNAPVELVILYKQDGIYDPTVDENLARERTTVSAAIPVVSIQDGKVNLYGTIAWTPEEATRYGMQSQTRTNEMAYGGKVVVKLPSGFYIELDGAAVNGNMSQTMRFEDDPAEISGKGRYTGFNTNLGIVIPIPKKGWEIKLGAGYMQRNSNSNQMPGDESAMTFGIQIRPKPKKGK